MSWFNLSRFRANTRTTVDQSASPTDPSSEKRSSTDKEGSGTDDVVYEKHNAAELVSVEDADLNPGELTFEEGAQTATADDVASLTQASQTPQEALAATWVYSAALSSCKACRQCSYLDCFSRTLSPV